MVISFLIGKNLVSFNKSIVKYTIVFIAHKLNCSIKIQINDQHRQHWLIG